MPDLDQGTDGLLVHGDNFQALMLLLERYGGDIHQVYIDPPYNATTSEIAYKNSYKHSSWATLMDNRIQCARPLLKAES
jgi:adenine-specific DNA-methyltransferase